MLANGLREADVAKRLGISVRGVEFHIEKIKKILKVKSTLERVNWLHRYFSENSEAMIV
jgi:DNA-binding CsgD family transcriptional regulator